MWFSISVQIGDVHLKNTGVRSRHFSTLRLGAGEYFFSELTKPTLLKISFSFSLLSNFAKVCLNNSENPIPLPLTFVAKKV